MENNSEVKKDIVVLYHADCTDGFGAAWAAWKKFGDRADYIGVYYSSPLPTGLTDKEIYTVDFVYSVEITNELIKNNKRLTAIDHHKTGEESIRITKDYVFDNDHSGSVLSWHYFHPDKPLPKILSHIEDMDLWKFNVPFTKEIIALLDSLGYDFEDWDKIIKEAENPEIFKNLVLKGEVILKYQRTLMESILNNNTEEVEFEGYHALAVNSPVFNSQIGSELAKKAQVGIVWKQNEKGIKFSLRSRDEIDVSEMAARFNDGGGHKNAAGFTLPLGAPLPWKVIKKDQTP